MTNRKVEEKIANKKRNIDHSPLIFLHIGDIFYLKYTLRSAVFHNPNTDVILIGDHYNKKYEDLGVKHFNFHDYMDSDDIKEFNKVYKLIGGTRFIEINASKGYDWTKYNFIKWFVLRNFLRKNNLSSCWTFDSDNMILCDLHSKRHFLGHIDCTVRPNFTMILGIINNIKVLDEYCQAINEQFKDANYLQCQKKEFEKEPKFGFTMMRAFMNFHETNKSYFNIDIFETEVNNEVFLDYLLLNNPCPYRLSHQLSGNKKVKLIYSDGKCLYVQRNDNKKLIKLNSVDLSWVPEYYFSHILRLTSDKKFNKTKSILKKVTFSPSKSYLIRNNVYKLKQKIKALIIL